MQSGTIMTINFKSSFFIIRGNYLVKNENGKDDWQRSVYIEMLS